MPTTPNFGWPIPEDTAQVANGPEIIRALGNAADATAFDQGTAITAVEGRVTTAETDITAVEGRVTTAETDITELETVGFRFVGTRYYTSDGTFAKADPFGNGSFDGAKLRAIRVRVVGGGGGSGGIATTGAGQFNAAGGGGSGGFAEKFITDIAGLSASITVTRGAGGAAGAAGNNAGSTGGQSLFVAVAGNGGTGGEGMPSRSTFTTSQPGFGGTASGGDLNLTGSAGGAGLAVSNDAFGNYGGFGAGSMLAGMRASVRVAASGGVNGSAGLLFGGGASGPANLASTTQRAGAAGANGIVIIDIFA